MKNLRSNKRKILILILIFIIILCVLLKIAQARDLKFQEDLIFFKLFDIGNIQEQKNISKEKSYEEKIYKINIKKGENNKKIDLLQSVDNKTLVNKKVAPGTKGSFYVYLYSSIGMDYEIKILDKSEKPENFKFEINEKKGRIEKNEIKKIEVNWKWPYEISNKKNIQDTEDGKNIEKYDFEICTVGK